MKTIVLLIALLSFPALPVDDTPVARATDLTLNKTELGEWLVKRYGVVYVQQFLAEQLLLREARSQGLFPSAAEVAAEWDTERTRVIEMIHHGREDRYESDLAGRGYSVETWAARRMHELTVDMCERRLAVAYRVVTEEALQSRFRDIYTEAGEHTVLEVLFFSAYGQVDMSDDRPDIGRLKSLALERARTAAAAWRAGATLDELRAESDTIHSEFVVDGRISAYRRSLLGAAVDKAVNSLDRPGEVSLPVEVFDGSYLVRLVERRDVSFESVREELTRMLVAEPATSGERTSARQTILDKREAEVLLR
jgi:hypothetical protein